MGAVVAATATKDASRMLLVTARQGRAGQESQTDSERERAGRGEQSRAEKGKRVGRAGVRAAAALFQPKKYFQWAAAGQLRRFSNQSGIYRGKRPQRSFIRVKAAAHPARAAIPALLAAALLATPRPPRGPSMWAINHLGSESAPHHIYSPPSINVTPISVNPL